MMTGCVLSILYVCYLGLLKAISIPFSLFAIAKFINFRKVFKSEILKCYQHFSQFIPNKILRETLNDLKKAK